MNAICLVIDRLHLGYLGAYGNSWVQTPAFDRLASEGFLFDQAFIDGSRLEGLYRSYWLGRHALEPDSAAATPALADILAERGVTPILLSDEPTVIEHPLAAGFGGNVFGIEPRQHSGVVEQVEETQMARCFAEAIDALHSARQPFLFWCHLQGLGAAWDAPLDFRRAYVDEGDPAPPDTAAVANHILAKDYDPDELLGDVQAYAGQVTLWDTCLGALLEFMDEASWVGETLLVLISPRGFPLGEHYRVGPADDALFNELTHVPMVLRLPNGVGAAARTQAMVEPADLWATLLDWWELGIPSPRATARSLLPLVRGDAVQVRDRLAIRGPDIERAILTPAWYMRTTPSPYLFGRPDDRWQVNNVADRLRDVVQSLGETLSQFEQAVQSAENPYLAPLEEVLVSGME